MLLGDILRRNAKLYPDKTAIIFEDKRYSYREIEGRANRLAEGLKTNGAVKEDRVGLLERPCPEYMELYTAIPKIGAVLTPLNCRLSGREMEYIINDAEIKILIFGKEFAETVHSIQPNLRTVKTYFCIGEAPSGIGSYEDLIKEFSGELPDIEFDDYEVAVQIYTSGTTGKPKGVMLTHKNMISMFLSKIIDFKLDSDDIFLSSVPFYHTAVLNALVMLYIGGTLIIHREFDPGHFLETIEAEKVTLALGVPSMINFLVQHNEKYHRDYDFSTLKTFFYGASPMPVALLRKAMETFRCNFIHSYGLTEASAGVAFLSFEDHPFEGAKEKVRRLTSCGKEIFNVNVRVVDKEGTEIKSGETGEITVRGDTVMKGYWKLPKETSETIKNGWLQTGDMATVDEEGYIYIVDRKNDMIISGGENIYPREVEEVLSSHPSVLEAAVIGVPDKKWGETVKAFVVLKEGENVSEYEVIDFCKNNLASYKKPSSIEFMDLLPRNSVGKVLKKKLREEYWKGFDRRVS